MPSIRPSLLAAVVLLAPLACGRYSQEIWICLDPTTGKLDEAYKWYDYAAIGPDGLIDPCHCYDPCGSQPQCPILVDAGPPPATCDAGDAGAGGGG